jgi:polyhydroxybutyrate depolymerase
MRLVTLALALLLAGPALACGPDTDCVIGERTYRLYVPETATGPMGALFFAHGYRGSAAGAMRNGALRQLADDLGMALVALKSAGDDWSLAHRPAEPAQTEAREYAYVTDVLADVAGRVALDGTKLVFSGFSAGGMMTWTIACDLSDRFAGFVPMSGTFWAPIPETCTTPPANIVHIHGTEDGTVPLGGRPIGPTKQGDVHRAMDMYMAFGGYAPDGMAQQRPADMLCQAWRNAGDKTLQFCSFPGGHSFSVQRLRYGIAQVLGGS